MGFIASFFDTDGFMPHGMCLLWRPGIFWLHAVSDSLIAISYYSIPGALIYFVRLRKDLAFSWMFYLFGGFILACGTTHLMAIWTLWNPDYVVDGLVKLFTAGLSLTTAVALWPLMPRALALPSQAQLENANRELSQEIAARRVAEEALQRLNEELEARVQAEVDERRKNYELLKAVTENTPAVVYVKDLEGRYLMVNRRYLEIFGIDRGAVIGRTDHDLFSKEAADAFRAMDMRVASADRALTEEETAPQKDGLHTYISVKAPLGDHLGRPYAVFGISTDITDLKRAQKALAETEERARLIVETALDAVIGMDSAGRILDWSPQAVVTFGWTRDEALGRPLAELIVPERLRAKHQEGVARYLATGEARVLGRRIELSALHRDGHEFPVELSITPIKTESGFNFSGFARDITERKRAETALAARTEELERSNRELDDFAYIASHDLKEPLRGIHNHARFLLDDNKDKLDEESVQRLARLTFLSQRMELLVNDLLYFSRLGRQDFAIRDISLLSLVDDIENTLSDFLAANGASIEAAADLPVVRCDATRVGELLRNLITNAVKYNDSTEKRVEIGWLPMKRRANGRLLRNVIFVRDNGRGIDPEFHEEVFRIFRRLQAPKEGDDGSGVGLTFVKKIVERHSGEIWLDSKVGEGTTFYFTLEAQHDDAGDSAATA